MVYVEVGGGGARIENHRSGEIVRRARGGGVGDVDVSPRRCARPIEVEGAGAGDGAVEVEVVGEAGRCVIDRARAGVVDTGVEGLGGGVG